MAEVIGTCCCAGGGGEPCCSCTAAVNLGREWSFSIAGIGNATCNACNDYNGNFTLRWYTDCGWADWRTTNVSQLCSGIGGGLDPLCEPYWNWRLTHHPVNGYTLTNSVFSPATYHLSLANWNCAGPNVMTLVSAGTFCSCYPPTVTLTRSANIQPVCRCTPPFPVIVEVYKVTGLTGGSGCCFPGTNLPLTRLTQDPGGLPNYSCLWLYDNDPPPGPCPDGFSRWMQLSYNGTTGAMELRVSGRGGTSTDGMYKRPVALFNPVGINEFTLMPGSGFPPGPCGEPIGFQICSSFPPTVFVEPF